MNVRINGFWCYLKTTGFIKRYILDTYKNSKNTTGMSKIVIFVFNGKIKVKILLHVPKTTIKEPPLVLHTAIHFVFPCCKWSVYSILL